MPEGHTLHRLARDQTSVFGGHVLAVSSPQGRFATEAATLTGRRLAEVTAYGKHLFQHFEGGLAVHVHLGLYGKFQLGTGAPPAPRGALRLRLVTADLPYDDDVAGAAAAGEVDAIPVGTGWADLRGATRCELIDDPAGMRAIIATLGPDPIRRSVHGGMRAFERIHGSKVAVGAQLMDQSRLAGVGNVYRAEILYRHRISPFRPGQDVTAGEWEALWADLVVLMRAGVRSGRIVTTRPADRPGGRVNRDTAHYVYRRDGQPCRVCGTPISKQIMVARNLFWCSTCQSR